MATPLSDRESRILRIDGQFIVTNTVSLLFQMMFWSMYVMVFAFAVYSLWRKRAKDGPMRARSLMLSVLIYMFLSSTAIFALGIYRMMIIVKHVNLKETLPGQSFGDKRTVALIAYYKANWAGNILFSIEFLIGDAVVIWRSWVLWQDRPWPLIFPVALWVGSLGTFFSSIIVHAVNIARAADWIVAGAVTEGVGDHLEWSNFYLSLGANAAATFLIAWRAWEYRKSIKESFGTGGTTRSQKVLMLFVESGFIYLVVWSLQTISYVSSGDYGPTGVAAGALAFSGNQIVGLYPTLIIVLVWWQQNVWDGPEVSLQIVSDIRYASRPANQPPETNGVGTQLTRQMDVENEDSSSSDLGGDREKSKPAVA